MKSFEKEIKKRILVLILYAVVFSSIIVIAFIIKLLGYIEADKGLSAANLAGFLVGMGVIVIYRIRIYINTLKSKEALEALHIKELDERNQIIAMKTCKSCIYLGLELLGIAGIITSFINQTIFLTIGVILIIFLILYGVLRLYYSKKY